MTDLLTPAAAGGLVLDGIAKTYGSRRALDPVSIELEPGASMAVVGPNGSGKSTLLRIVAGVLTADAGRARVAGDAPGAGACAMVQPAGRGLHPRLSARHNIEFFARLAGRRPADRIAAEAAEALGAAALLDRRVTSISAGEARRIAIAAGFATAAPVVAIDEPFEHLDEPGRDGLRALAAAWTAAGGTVVFAFPQPADGPECDRTLTLTARDEHA